MIRAPRPGLGASALALAAGVALGGLVAAVSGRPSASPAPSVFALPDPPRPGLAIPAPGRLGPGRFETRWAPVLVPVRARRGPSRRAMPVAKLETNTPEGTTNIVLVLGRTSDGNGRVWLRIRVPALPNNTTGWVPRSALGGYGVVSTRLVVDRQRLTATLFRGGRVVFRAQVGVGAATAPTPRGEFYVRNRLAGFGNPFYGPLAFGTSARSDVLTDWPGGGFVGIHGTDRPDLIPGRVSHGCIRLRNADVLTLGRLMPVGTPLTIR